VLADDAPGHLLQEFGFGVGEAIEQFDVGVVNCRFCGQDLSSEVGSEQQLSYVESRCNVAAWEDLEEGVNRARPADIWPALLACEIFHKR
jgi:hypothetical protein